MKKNINVYIQDILESLIIIQKYIKNTKKEGQGPIDPAAKILPRNSVF